MGSTTISVIKTLIAPAVIALILYLVLAYGIVPFWRHYRERYSQYIPLDSIVSNRVTTGIRDRVYNGVANLVFNPPWRRRNGEDQVVAATDGDISSDDGTVSMYGEEMGAMNEERRRRLMRSAQNPGSDSERRLSRDLEEGFMDDSDEDETEPQAGRTRVSLR